MEVASFYFRREFMIQRQKGCNDIYGREAKIWKYVDGVIDALMEKYNYTYIRTPLFLQNYFIEVLEKLQILFLKKVMILKISLVEKLL